MKKYINIFAVALIILFTSCDKDLLDKKPLDAFSGEAVWSDNDLAQAFINNVYNDVLGLWYSRLSDDWTDNVMFSEFGNADNTFPGAGGTMGPAIKNGVFTKTLDVGWNRFSLIRKCNLAIEKLTGNELIPEASRQIMIAEATMMRGLVYFWQARHFGGLIILNKTLAPGDDFKLARSSEADTYTFIIKDMEDAALALPAKPGQGRLSKYAAYGFLSRVYLHVGQYDKAIDACNKVEEGGFTLDTYYNISKNYAAQVSSPEIILSYAREKTYQRFGQTHHQRFLPGISNAVLAAGAPPLGPDGLGGWLQLYPPQELVDDYLFIEGDQAVQKKGVEFVGKSSGLMWKNRDERFDLSIVRDSSWFYNNFVYIRDGGNCYRGAWPAVPSQQTSSGYYFRRFIYEDQPQGYPTPINYALPLLRLGEIYLNKAEAYYRKGDLANAIEYTNKTRTEHGKLPAISGVSPSEFFKWYKIERRVELMYEHDRYWSLLRWAKADNANAIPELVGQYTSLHIKADGTVELLPWFHISGSMVFEYPKRAYFPIPDAEMLNNDKLTQNPGW